MRCSHVRYLVLAAFAEEAVVFLALFAAVFAEVVDRRVNGFGAGG